MHYIYAPSDDSPHGSMGHIAFTLSIMYVHVCMSAVRLKFLVKVLYMHLRYTCCFKNTSDQMNSMYVEH